MTKVVIYTVNVVRPINPCQNFTLILVVQKIGIITLIIAKLANLINIRLEELGQRRMIPIFSLEI